MAVYDYLCTECGPFTFIRPMAECDESANCPGCAAQSPRALLNAPQLSCMPAGRRTAFATNERSAHAPRTLGEYKAAHGPGCGCCASKSSRMIKKEHNGAKSFPSARPWMISH